MLSQGDHMSTISDAVPLTARHYVCLVHQPLIRTDALIRGPWSCCVLACGNYTVSIEHCFWMPHDKHADNDDWWFSYVKTCDKLTA